jgi:hypothetical protein
MALSIMFRGPYGTHRRLKMRILTYMLTFAIMNAWAIEVIAKPLDTV